MYLETILFYKVKEDNKSQRKRESEGRRKSRGGRGKRRSREGKEGAVTGCGGDNDTVDNDDDDIYF